MRELLLLLREYGRGPGVRGFGGGAALEGAGLANLGGAGLANLGGAPIALLENPDGVRPPFLPGVAAAVLTFWRTGDSGRDSDGRRTRVPGPMDCENLALSFEGESPPP